MEPVKLMLSQNVYRRPATTNEMPANGYLPVGSTIEVSDVLLGKEIDGNCIWYHADDGYFYWSGGVSFLNSQFLLPHLIFRELKQEDQLTLCKQAVREFGDIWRKEYPEINVISITNKEQGQLYKSYLSIVFLTLRKGAIETKELPDKIIFKGFTIPTDVKSAKQPELCYKLDDWITKPNYNFKGTGGFFASDGVKEYLVTCYHVLCKDLLNRSPAIKSLSFDSEYKRFVTELDEKTGIGNIISGVFGSTSDSVKVEITGNLDNIIPTIGKISGIKKRNEFPQFKAGEVKVKIVGATTISNGGHIKEGTIESLHSDFEIVMENHTFQDIIQVKRLPSSLAAQHGDSGGAVLTQDNKLVGIVAATDLENYSYVIPISTLFKDLNLKFLI